VEHLLISKRFQLIHALFHNHLIVKPRQTHLDGLKRKAGGLQRKPEPVIKERMVDLCHPLLFRSEEGMRQKGRTLFVGSWNLPKRSCQVPGPMFKRQTVLYFQT